MKKKITAILLCVILMITLSVSVSAVASIGKTQPLADTQITPITNESMVNVEEGVQISETENLNDNTVVPSAQTTGIVSGGVYRIKNVGSGKYMNVHYGIDANGTNIYQWTADGSTEQKWKVVYSSSTDSYLLYSMCSSSGTNRVADIYDSGGVLVNGANIKLHDPIEPPTQQIQIISVGTNKYRIAMKQNNNFVYTAYGTSNGSASGTTSTSAGNIFISTYTGATNQQWQFELLQNPNTGAIPVGYLDSVTTSTIGGWAYQSNVPNTALTVHIYIKNNSTGEETVISTLANQYRADLATAGYGDGYHAFHYDMNWKTYKPGTYTVRAYALGVNSSNPQLTNTKSFTVRNVEGYAEIITSTYIEGWVWKPDAPNEPLDVHAYIYRSNGQVAHIATTIANHLRTDLISAGKGNGYHGYRIYIDFDSLPEENLRIELHYLDGSGYNPSFYVGYYDNRKQISLLGMVDYQGYDHSTWMRNDEVVNYCENIGCSSLLRNNIADIDYYTRMIRDSSYCAIATHGPSPDEETGEIYYDAIQWSMRGVYNGHTECENKYCPTCFGWYTTDDLKELSNGYFSSTRCVALVACYAGYNRENNPDNFVNVLQSKGVWTVVGFELATQTVVYEGTKIVDPDAGSQKWLKEFTKFLGKGETVQNATILATAATTENGFSYGTDKCYIAGDKFQIVKH